MGLGISVFVPGCIGQSMSLLGAVRVWREWCKVVAWRSTFSSVQCLGFPGAVGMAVLVAGDGRVWCWHGV